MCQHLNRGDTKRFLDKQMFDDANHCAIPVKNGGAEPHSAHCGRVGWPFHGVRHGQQCQAITAVICSGLARARGWVQRKQRKSISFECINDSLKISWQIRKFYNVISFSRRKETKKLFIFIVQDCPSLIGEWVYQMFIVLKEKNEMIKFCQRVTIFYF